MKASIAKKRLLKHQSSSRPDTDFYELQTGPQYLLDNLMQVSAGDSVSTCWLSAYAIYLYLFMKIGSFTHLCFQKNRAF